MRRSSLAEVQHPSSPPGSALPSHLLLPTALPCFLPAAAAGEVSEQGDRGPVGQGWPVPGCKGSLFMALQEKSWGNGGSWGIQGAGKGAPFPSTFFQSQGTSCVHVGGCLQVLHPPRGIPYLSLVPHTPKTQGWLMAGFLLLLGSRRDLN